MRRGQLAAPVGPFRLAVPVIGRSGRSLVRKHKKRRIISASPLLLLAQSTGAAAIASNILLGVVGGIVTSIVIYLFSVVWNKQLVPWYKQRVYKGVSVQGMWFLVDDKETEPADRAWTQIETFDIAQTAQHISGAPTLAPKEGVDGPVVALTMTGEIANRFVTVLMTADYRGPA